MLSPYPSARFNSAANSSERLGASPSRAPSWRPRAVRDLGRLNGKPAWFERLDTRSAGRFDVVLTESLDRLSRDLADSAALHKQLGYWGVRIVTLADGDVTKALVAIKGLLGSIFLDDLAQKTKRGQVGRVKAGRIPGGRCYGYDVVQDGDRGLRKINEAEAAIVRRIFAEYAEGRSPLAIVEQLNREKFRAPRGGSWNASTLNGSRQREKWHPVKFTVCRPAHLQPPALYQRSS